MILRKSSLEGILSDFSKVVDRLTKHAALKDAEAATARTEAAKLLEEVAAAFTEAEKARSIAGKVGSLIS